MSNKLIIGIAGRSRVGKDTAALFFAQMLHLARYTLAEPITRACAAALCIDHEIFLKLQKNEWLDPLQKTLREFMQTMGDALISNNPNFLMQSLDERVAKSEDEETFFNGYVITDLRTPQECQWARNKGAAIVHILKDNAVLQPEHRTECDLYIEPGDFVVRNDGDLEQFINKLRAQIPHLIYTQQRNSVIDIAV